MHKIIETRVDDWLDSVEDQLFNDLRTKTANEILNSLAKYLARISAARH